MENWQVGNKLEDNTATAGPGVSIIDNSVRTILASTQAITQALLCLMNEANAGVQAPQVPGHAEFRRGHSFSLP